MSKHTPGPWTAEGTPEGGWRIEAVVSLEIGVEELLELFRGPAMKDIHFYFDADKQQLCAMLAYIREFPTQDWEEMQEANSLLVAAAPDLLEACVRARQDLVISGFPEEDPTIKAIDAALEKASV